jgi:hypothetical protein
VGPLLDEPAPLEDEIRSAERTLERLPSAPQPLRGAGELVPPEYVTSPANRDELHLVEHSSRSAQFSLDLGDRLTVHVGRQLIAATKRWPRSGPSFITPAATSTGAISSRTSSATSSPPATTSASDAPETLDRPEQQLLAAAASAGAADLRRGRPRARGLRVGRAPGVQWVAKRGQRPGPRGGSRLGAHRGAVRHRPGRRRRGAAGQAPRRGAPRRGDGGGDPEDPPSCSGASWSTATRCGSSRCACAPGVSAGWPRISPRSVAALLEVAADTPRTSCA